MFHHVTRLCSPALVLMSAAALAAPATSQSEQQINAEIRLLDANQQPLPADFVIFRDRNGFVLNPTNEVSGGFLIRNAGQKLSIEFAPKNLKSRSINLVLENAPKVYISMIVDPRTGQVKSLTQKPYYANTRADGKIRKSGGGQIGFIAPPANDTCGTPLAIGVGATAYDTSEATTDGPANGCGSGSQVHNDVWFDFLAPGNGTLTISTCNSAAYDTALAIHSGLSCPPAAPLACNDDFAGCAGFTSQASAAVSAGQHYLLRVGGFGAGSRGTGTLNVSFVGAGLPADECAGAIDVDCDTSGNVDSTGATTAGSDPAFSCRFGGPGQGFGSVWFSFQSTGTGVTLDTSASTVSDTMLALYDGTCGALVELACDDDSGTGLRSLLTYNFLTPGNTYYVQVAGFGAGDRGPITLDVDCLGGGGGNNDECANATEIACGGSGTFDNSAYTTDALDPAYSCRFGGPGQGVGTGWFKFVATNTSARIDTNLSTAPDTLLAVYSGTCGAFTELACSDDDGVGLLSEVCVDGLTIGDVYYIQASSFSSFDTGSITVSVACPCPGAPANDDCTGAEALVLPASVTLDNSFATDDIGVSCGVFSGPFKNVWYSVAGTGTTLTATTCSAGTLVSDTIISVFCADCGALICVGGNDDNCPGGGPTFASTVSWCSQLGANYFITVGNFSSSTTPGTIQLDVFDTFSSCVADVVCLPQGACCLSDGSCSVTTIDDCEAQGGTYQGDGTTCTSNAIVDGGFEAGAFSGNWNEFSTNFGTPLCDAFCGFGGGTGPHSGSWWAWFGGIGTFEAGSVDQNVVIPANATTLEFWLEIPVSSGNGVDFLRVEIDGNTVFSVLENDGVYAGTGYNLVSIPLGGFADGGNHNISFNSEQLGTGGAITNFFVDDVSVNTVTISCPQPTGSCCLADGSCVEVSGDDCAALGGTYGGDNSLCVDANCPQPIACFTLDFTTDDSGAGMVHGTKVDTEFDGGANYPVTITGSANPSGNNTAAILNSSTGPAAQDPDLLVGSGNILILQSDTNQTQCGAGIYCSHNDDADGGTLTFDFNVPTTPGTIDLIDIDGTDAPSSVVLTDSSGRTRTYAVPGNWTGDITVDGPPGMGTLSLTTLANQPGFASIATATQNAGFDPDAVVRIVVTLGGSGAVDNLTWCQAN